MKFSVYIRLLIENYFQMCLLSLIVYHKFLSFSNWKLSFNSILCYIILLFCAVWPILTFAFLYRNKYRRKEKSFIEKYGSFFEGIKEWKILSIYLIIPFLLRRSVFALSIMYLDMELQVIIQIMLSLALLCYYISS